MDVNVFDVMSLLNENSKSEAVKDNERVDYRNIIPHENNEFDLQSIEELAESIATVGLEQNLVVKETDDPNTYQLVTGHRRWSAIKYIFDHEIEIDEKIRKDIERPLCKIISKEEDPLVTEFRLFETNMQARANKDYEMLGIIDKYLSLIQRAKEKGILINGKAVKGKTKELLSQQFGISERTAVKYSVVLKTEDEELKDKVLSGELTVNSAYNEIQSKTRKKDKKNKPVDKFIIDLQDKIESKVQTKVEIKPKKVSFYYENTDDLNRLLDLLGLGNVVNEDEEEII